MKSIFKKPHLQAQGSRNAFDNSHKRVFHAPFGALIPCMVLRTNPDDYFEIGAETQTIIEPLAAPAFMRLKEHIDYFFVPYAQLWSPFDNFFAQQDQYRSTTVQTVQGARKVPFRVPMMNYAFVKQMLYSLTQSKDEHGFSEAYGALRVLDGLKYGNLFGMMSTLDDEAHDANNMANLPEVNLFALLAYQKIYFDYYRNTKYEECQVTAYNIDNLQSEVTLVGADAENEPNSYKDWFRMRYRWQKKDYFMSVQPNVLPDANQIGFKGLFFNDFDSSEFTTQYTGLKSQQNFGVPGARGEFNTQPKNNQFSILNDGPAYKGRQFFNVAAATSNLDSSQLSPARIRLMFAYDRYLRRMREAGGTFDAQMEAIYGVTPNDNRFGNVVKIGGQTNRLFLNDVTNVSESGEYGLGSLGGNVNNYSQPRSTFKFHCKEAGLIIGIYSTSIDNDYPSFMVDRMHTSRTRMDWFTPQFQDLGLQAMFRYELNYLTDNLSDYPQGSEPSELRPDKFATADEMWDLLGYNRRYAEYKTQVDTVHGLFASKVLSPELSVWVAKYMPRKYDGEVQVCPLHQPTMTYNPSSLNDVTNVEYDGTPQLDQFKVHHFNHVKRISNMTVHGETW